MARKETGFEKVVRRLAEIKAYQENEGYTEPPKDTPLLGAYAVDDPEAHAANKSAKPRPQPE